MASNRKFRIVRIATLDAFGRPVEWYAVQRRVAFFWWVTVEHYFSQLTQARYWLHKSCAPHHQERVIKVVE